MENKTKPLSQRDLRREVSNIIFGMQKELRAEISALTETVGLQKRLIKKLQQEPITDVHKMKIDYEKLKTEYKILCRKYEVDMTTKRTKEVPEKYDTMAIVCDHFKITQAKLVGKCRDANLVKARHICCYVLFNKGLSLAAIGRLLNRDHSTAIWGRNKMLDLITTGQLDEKETMLIYNLLTDSPS